MWVFGTSRSQCGHHRFCWIRVWHSACSWLKLIVAPASVAGNTFTGMLTRLIFRYPFHVGRAAIGCESLPGGAPSAPGSLDRCDLLVDFHLKLPEIRVRGDRGHFGAVVGLLVRLAHLARHQHAERRLVSVDHLDFRADAAIAGLQRADKDAAGARLDPEPAMRWQVLPAARPDHRAGRVLA